MLPAMSETLMKYLIIGEACRLVSYTECNIFYAFLLEIFFRVLLEKSMEVYIFGEGILLFILIEVKK